MMKFLLSIFVAQVLGDEYCIVGFNDGTYRDPDGELHTAFSPESMLDAGGYDSHNQKLVFVDVSSAKTLAAMDYIDNHMEYHSIGGDEFYTVGEELAGAVRNTSFESVLYVYSPTYGFSKIKLDFSQQLFATNIFVPVASLLISDFDFTNDLTKRQAYAISVRDESIYALDFDLSSVTTIQADRFGAITGITNGEFQASWMEGDYLYAIHMPTRQIWKWNTKLLSATSPIDPEFVRSSTLELGVVDATGCVSPIFYGISEKTTTESPFLGPDEDNVTYTIIKTGMDLLQDKVNNDALRHAVSDSLLALSDFKKQSLKSLSNLLWF